MSLLWVNVPRIAKYGDEPTEQSWHDRSQRVDRFLQRQPGETMHIRHNWSPGFSNQWAHGLIEKYDGPTDDRHWEHLPDQYVSLRQRIHTHQGFVYPETVRQKISEDASDDPYAHDDYREPEPGGSDPKFVRHQGEHYMLDGHHRLVKARLMGDSSMYAKVFDTSNPEHKQENCYECHREDVDNGHEYDHDSEDCEKCQKHGWYV